MNGSSESSERTHRLLFALTIFAAATFAALWLAALERKPRVVVEEVEKPVPVKTLVPVERVKEVPVEKIKEVPKEVVREVQVPAELTDAQRAALEFSSNYVAAPTLASLDDALYKVDSIAVRVNVRDEVKRAISDQLIKSRYERIFRDRGVPMDDNSPYWLGINYDGRWYQDNLLVYGVHLELYDSVTLERKNDIRRSYAIVWAHDDIAYAPIDLAPQLILSNAETNADYFARHYRATQERVR